MSRRPALSGAPGADSKSLILRNRACLSSVSLLESAYRGGATKTLTSNCKVCLKSGSEDAISNSRF